MSWSPLVVRRTLHLAHLYITGSPLTISSCSICVFYSVIIHSDSFGKNRFFQLLYQFLFVFEFGFLPRCCSHCCFETISGNDKHSLQAIWEQLPQMPSFISTPRTLRIFRKQPSALRNSIKSLSLCSRPSVQHHCYALELKSITELVHAAVRMISEQKGREFTRAATTAPRTM